MGVIAATAAALAALAAGAGATAWLERRMAAGELGPAQRVSMRVALDPARQDPWLYHAGPVLALVGVAWAALVIPAGRALVVTDLDIGAFYYLVVMDFVALGIAVGGWGADTKDAVEACYRAIAQLVAYVVPLGLAVIGPLMMARTLSTVSIVEAQVRAGYPYVVVQPLGFALYLATLLMQTYRRPFLEPFAQQIGGGVLAVYGGWHGVAWRLALSGVLLVGGAMGAVLYLGGYAGPFLPGPVWLALKSFAICALVLVVGRRLRPRSTAETLALGWRVLLPVGLVNVLVVGALILLGVGQAPFARLP